MKLHRVRLAAAACGAAVLTAVGLTPTAAYAATVTVSGGPDVDFVGNSVSFTDTAAGQTLTCTTFDLSGGPITTGTITTPAIIGTAGTLTSSGCTNPIMGTETVTPIGTWSYQVDSATTGELTNVTAFIAMAGCSYTVGGTVTGTWNNNAHTFSPTSSTLTIIDTPSGFICPLLGWEQGDHITVSGSWTNTPPAGSSQLNIGTPPPPGSTVVSGGPTLDAVGSSVAFTDPAAGQTLTCTTFDLSGGPITTGPISTPAVIADMSSVTSSGCTNPIVGATTVDPTSTWHYRVDSPT
jgi:hypothetical protein